MKKFIYTILMAMVFLSHASLASNHDKNLFQSEISVKDRSQQQWDIGVKKALINTLIKVSGNSKINTLPEIKQLPPLSSLIQSFSYQRKSIYGKLNQLHIIVNFDQLEIKKLLKNFHQPIWLNQRPTTLVWLAKQNDDNNTEIISNDTQDETIAMLDSTADRRGISVKLPNVDLDDISKISGNDVWKFNTSIINEASQRYGTESYLAVRTHFDEDQYWHATCLWVADGVNLQWTLTDKDFPDLLANIVNRLADEMAAQFVSNDHGSHNNQLLIRVTGVSGIDDYTKVVNYLHKLPQVKDVDVNGIEAGAAILAINYRGDENTLTTAIKNAIGHQLQPIDENESPNHDAVALVYKWLETTNQT